MFKSTKVERLIATRGRGVLLLGGCSAPAWATYGGGACHSCTPAPGDRDPVRSGVAWPPGSRPSTRPSMRRFTTTSPSP